MAHRNSSSIDSASHDERNLLRELAILSSIFLGLIILAIRPFGYRTFLNGVAYDNVFSLLLGASAVALILVIIQRIGLILHLKYKPDEKFMAYDVCNLYQTETETKWCRN